MGRKTLEYSKWKIVEAQVSEILKERAAFEIESGMLDDEYITSVMETICTPTKQEAATKREELFERLLLVAEQQGLEAVSDLYHQRPDLF